MGTQVQCWSQNFWKSVRYLSEICQKTVSCKNQSEISQKCVRYLSENSQMQNCVRSLLEKIWKSVRNVSVFKIVSEYCQFVIQKTVRNVSEKLLRTDFWHIYNDDIKHFQETFPKNCQKTVKWHISDTLLLLGGNRSHCSDIFLTDFWITNWQFSDTILKTNTFLTDFWIFSNKLLTQFCIWLFSDRYLTHLWLISDWFLQLTVFWQISDRYLTDFQKFRDQH